MTSINLVDYDFFFAAENKPDKKKTFAKATFAYSPQHDDELGLEIGELVEITKQV